MTCISSKVWINRWGQTISGLLFTPDNLESGEHYPAIVICNPAGAVKEQVPSTYARAMAEAGFIALAFDTFYQGESGGFPRRVEDPSARVEDIRCAVDYLVALPFVDSARIAALGICSGGGYAANAAMTERRIKAVAGVSTTDPGSWMRNGIDGSVTPQEQIETLEAICAGRTSEVLGGEEVLIPYVPDEVDSSTPPALAGGHDYYCTDRGRHPRAQNRVKGATGAAIMAFDCFNFADTLLTQPLLLIAGAEADTLHFSERLFSLAPGEKELVRIPGAGHVDLYDREPYLSEALHHLIAFFGRVL